MGEDSDGTERIAGCPGPGTAGRVRIGLATAETASRALLMLLWHGDTLEDLPRNAVHLARSELCRNQAFRYGTSVWVLEFHLEVTAELIERWLEEPDNRRELAELDHVHRAIIRTRTPQALPLTEPLGGRVQRDFAGTCARRGGRASRITYLSYLAHTFEP